MASLYYARRRARRTGLGVRSKVGQLGGAFIPAIAGAVSVGVWVHLEDRIGDGYLVDFRQNGGNYWYAEGTDNPNRITIAGQTPSWDDFFLRTSPVFTGAGRQKVYLQFPTTASGFHWLARYTNNEFAKASLGNPLEFFDLTIYSRAWTDAERFNATDPLPADSILAHYDGKIANGQLLDATGNGHHATILGGPLESFSY